MDLTELKVTYEELFELLEFSQTDFHTSQLSEKPVYVNTPTGFTKVLGGVIKDSLDMLNVQFSDGSECNVADTHIFSCNKKEIYARDAEWVDTLNGSLRITKKTKIGTHHGYDISIADPHWYYAPNGVIYHNSLLMTDLISGMIKNNKKILLVSLEMEDKEIMKRVHANAMSLPINSLSDLSKTEGELRQLESPTRSIVSKEQVLAAYNELKLSGTCGKLFIKDYPPGTFSALMLERLIETYKLEQNIEFDIVFVDYLGIMKSDLLVPSAGLYSYVKSIGEEVRSVAKKLKLPVVSASQLNRCLHPDVQIQLVNSAIKLSDIKIGQMLSTGVKVVSKVKTEKQKMYRIVTKSGKELLCSGEHKFPTNKGTMTINVGLTPGLKLNSI